MCSPVVCRRFSPFLLMNTWHFDFPIFSQGLMIAILKLLLGRLQTPPEVLRHVRFSVFEHSSIQQRLRSHNFGGWELFYFNGCSKLLFFFCCLKLQIWWFQTPLVWNINLVVSKARMTSFPSAAQRCIPQVEPHGATMPAANGERLHLHLVKSWTVLIGKKCLEKTLFLENGQVWFLIGRIWFQLKMLDSLLEENGLSLGNHWALRAASQPLQLRLWGLYTLRNWTANVDLVLEPGWYENVETLFPCNVAVCVSFLGNKKNTWFWPTAIPQHVLCSFDGN